MTLTFMSLFLKISISFNRWHTLVCAGEALCYRGGLVGVGAIGEPQTSRTSEATQWAFEVGIPCSPSEVRDV